MEVSSRLCSTDLLTAKRSKLTILLRQLVTAPLVLKRNQILSKLMRKPDQLEVQIKVEESGAGCVAPLN